MIKAACFLTSVILAGPLAASAQPSGASQMAPDARVAATQVLNNLDSAWNALDGARFAAQFTEDADLINIFGGYYRGRAAIATRMQNIFDTIFKDSHHRSRELEIARYLAPDTIIVLSSAVVDVPSGPLAPAQRNRQTFILVKDAGNWKIRHWHNTPIRDREK